MKFIYSTLLALILLTGCSSPATKYDKKTKQTEVLTYSGIDSVLNSFDKISFKELPQEYKQYADLKQYSGFYKSGTWYVIKGKDVYKYLVGNFRVMDFLPEDKYYGKLETQYLLFDKRVAYKFLDLMTELKKQGHDPYAFKVYNGFRHPGHNDKVGGAHYSQHLYGKAIDIKVKDINKDGLVNQLDKKIVLDLLENKIIGSKGGVGRYTGTMSIHFDVRGHKARWNGYNRKDGST